MRPQQGKEEKDKAHFWMNLESVKFLNSQCIIAGDLNGHVGELSDRYERTHGGRGYGTRNKEGETILDFAEAKDFIIANTHFDKPMSKRATYCNGDMRTQLDYFLVRPLDRKQVKNVASVVGRFTTNIKSLCLT